DDSSMSAMEKELARIRGLLEKEHGNDYDMTYTWLNPNTGEKVPLSPMAMDEWTRAIYSGLADKKHPPTDPYSPHFGSINRQSSIQPFAPRTSSFSCNHLTAAPANPGVVSDLAHLATIMAMITPQTPAHLKTATPPPDITIPIKNTPSKLLRFLEYAETNVGVEHATQHLLRLQEEGYGPDILDQVDDKDLKILGIKHGDVLRLKRAAPLWLNGPDAKCKVPSAASRASASASLSSSGSSVNLFPNWRRFEKRWNDGSGASSAFGQSMRLLEDDEMPDPTITWWYFSELTKSMLRVPEGYVPVLEGQ
ncbi:hypothetical protein F5877DRAFT_10621, partial [Lentinula edodes]